MQPTQTPTDGRHSSQSRPAAHRAGPQCQQLICSLCKGPDLLLTVLLPWCWHSCTKSKLSGIKPCNKLPTANSLGFNDSQELVNAKQESGVQMEEKGCSKAATVQDAACAANGTGVRERVQALQGNSGDKYGMESQGT